jgi:hypothetical protein
LYYLNIYFTVMLLCEPFIVVGIFVLLHVTMFPFEPNVHCQVLDPIDIVA